MKGFWCTDIFANFVLVNCDPIIVFIVSALFLFCVISKLSKSNVSHAFLCLSLSFGFHKNFGKFSVTPFWKRVFLL